MDLSISNIIDISIGSFNPGVNAYNTSNLAIITTEQVASSVQLIEFSGVAASGNWSLKFDSATTQTYEWDDDASIIQAGIRTLTGMSETIVTGSLASKKLTIMQPGNTKMQIVNLIGSTLETAGSVAITNSTSVISTGWSGGNLGYSIYISPTQVGKDFGTNSITYKQANAIFSQQPNILAGGGKLIVILQNSGETYSEAIARTQGLVNYFGVMSNYLIENLTQEQLLDTAAVIAPLSLIGFFVTHLQADIEPGGKLDLLRSGTFTNSRGLYYGDDGSFYGDESPVVMMAAYAGRALSVNFSGSNTTETENLKQLIGIQPDPTMTQTIYQLAQDSGADIYASFGGDPCIVSNGANKFFDQVYNLKWFVGGLQVAGFNFLAGAATKVPQTEQGMDGLKNAYGTICEQGKTNGYIAAGKWTAAETFGNQALFFQNISQVGYYIYALPLSQQLAVDRAARKAPLVQIAVKEAGAIHTSSVIIYVNP